MTRTQAAFALAMSFPAWLAGPAVAQKPPPPSPLSMDPARISYLRNDAPFVVFDIAPHRLDLRHGAGVQTVLNFIATDPLQRVEVFATTAAPFAPAQATACSAKVAGYYSCAIRIADAITWLDGRDGQLALRIEAEGLARNRSVVQITLPVLGTGARPARNDAVPARTLTLLSAAVSQ